MCGFKITFPDIFHMNKPVLSNIYDHDPYVHLKRALNHLAVKSKCLTLK